MKVVLRGYGINMTPQQRQQAKSQAKDLTRTRGTNRQPFAPRAVITQSSARGVLVSWSLPDNPNADVQRWRVYKGDESTLYQEINDRGIRQCIVSADSGSSPAAINVFVSAVNSLGRESVKVQAQGTPTAEAGAPSVPSAPLANTGVNTSTNYLDRKQNEVVNLIP